MSIISKREKLTVVKKTKFHERSPNFHQQWYRKWNHIFATIFCLLSMLCLLVLIINIWTYDCIDSRKSFDQKSHPYFLMEKLFTTKYCNMTGHCNVVCKNIHENITVVDVLKDFFQTEDFQNNCLSHESLVLTITDSNFPSQRLSEGWLQVENYFYSKINLRFCNIHTIDTNAFSGQSMSYTDSLEIVNGYAFNIKNGAFNIKNLTVLKLESINISNIEPEAIKHITSIDTLQVLDSFDKNELLENFTGSGSYQFSALNIVDLQNNKLEVIKEKTFSGFTAMVSLYLTSSGLQRIEPKAFINCPNLKQLFIDSNSLHTLEINIFPPGGIINMYIRDNKWNCDSNLTWFCSWFIQDLNITNCCTPTTENGKLITDSLCNLTTTQETSTESTTTEVSISTTEMREPEIIALKCNDEEFYSSRQMYNPTYFRANLTTANIVHFNITTKLLTNNQVEVSINFSDISTSHTLIWFQEDIDFDYNTRVIKPMENEVGCILKSTEVATFSLTDPKENYIICAADTHAPLSPFSCRSFETKTVQNVNNVHTYSTVVFVSLAVLMSMVFGLIVGVFRRRAKNETFCNLESHGQDHKCDMHCNDAIRYRNPFPTHHYERLVFESPKYEIPRRFPALQRSESKGSIGSIYVSPLEPTPFELLAWRISQQHNVRDSPSPPPLPPHPLRRTEISDTESIRSSIISINNY